MCQYMTDRATGVTQSGAQIAALRREVLLAGVFRRVVMPQLPTPLQQLEKSVLALLERNAHLEKNSGESGAELTKLRQDYTALSERYQKLAAQHERQQQQHREAADELKAVRKQLIELRALVRENQDD